MSPTVRKLTLGHMHPVNIQIRPCIHAVWSESSLDTDVKFLHADNKDWLAWADEQADLSLCRVHMSKGTFSHSSAYIKSKIFAYDLLTLVLLNKLRCHTHF